MIHSNENLSSIRIEKIHKIDEINNFQQITAKFECKYVSKPPLNVYHAPIGLVFNIHIGVMLPLQLGKKIAPTTMMRLNWLTVLN